MALIKSTILESGFTAEYWRINKFYIDIDTRRIRVEFKLYKDSTWRTENGPESHVKETFEIWRSEELINIIKASTDNILSDLYSYAKTTNLIGAVDG